MKPLIALITLTLLIQVVFAQNSNNITGKPFISKYKYQNDHIIDERLHHYDVGFYFLDLEMNNTSVNVSGTATILLNLEESYSGQLVFDLKNNMSHNSVFINDNPASAIRNGDLMVIPYTHNQDYNENYQVKVEINYNGSPSSGMYNKTYTYLGQDFISTFSITEPYLAKYWFPCKQVLTDKADSSYVFITVPQDLKVGSNGLLTNEVDLGNGKIRMEWKSSFPIVYYLISVAVGDYAELSYYKKLHEFNDSVFIQNYYPNSTDFYNDYQWNMRRIDTMLSVLSHLWGIYPHHKEKYGHCLVDLNGGMEHQTMTTLGNFGFRLVVHELGHSWFGNYVTCATWQDIWINEGFASYAEYLGEEYIQPEGYEDGWLEETQNTAKNAPSGSIYVPFEELADPYRIFNYELSYRKGACIVHMIRYLINDDELFFHSLRTFLSNYANGTATGEDMKTTLQNETGINFETFFNNWYYGEGYPIYNVEWYQQGNDLHIRNIQTSTAGYTPFFEIPVEYELIYSNGDKDTIRLDQTQNIQDYTLNLTGTIDSITMDPENWILKELESVEYNSVAAFEQTKFTIYPNPTNDIIYINTSENGCYNVCIYSSDGKNILDEHFYGLSKKLNVTDLSKGIYILMVKNDFTGKKERFKLIKV